MIITKISGGLGNQMFQYATGRVLAEKNQDILKLDTSAFDVFHPVDTLRSYALDIFTISAYIANRREIMRLADPNPLIVLINRYLKTHMQPYPKGFTKEIDHRYHQEIIETKGDIYLQGFWQSEKYFLYYRDLILKEFTFRNKPNQKNKRLLKAMDHTESISIHVRRGDYVTNSQANKFHGTCDIGYYKKAIKHIVKKCSSPNFYVFSDDIEWCKKNLHIPYLVTYVAHNQGEKSWQDMRLMSNCKHNIIANSSFSWWGAWLNTNARKIVIAPKNWFRDKSVQTDDLIPTTWIKM